ncbi:MAG: DMT family transporter [Alphaproteobacteria bacterium]|nr:DMT family transporter [Alphaproteobacteria bacterium]
MSRAARLIHSLNLLSALWMLASTLLFTAMGGLVKFLGGHYESFQIAFFRSGFGLLTMLPFVLAGGWGVLRTQRLWLHLARGICGATAQMCNFFALTKLHLADAVAISYARTLFLIPLAVLFLGEAVRARRWSATLLGFAGVLIMLRPAGEIAPATLVAVTGALIAAGTGIMLKQLAASERPATVMLYFGLVSTSATALPALLVWRAVDLADLALLLLMGGCGSGGQYCMVRAFRVGEATAVLPVDYLRLILASAVGYFVFAEVPDRWTALGAAIVVGATLYIALREARLGRAGSLSGPAREL